MGPIRVQGGNKAGNFGNGAQKTEHGGKVVNPHVKADAPAGEGGKGV
jgi:hypothetical protein